MRTWTIPRLLGLALICAGTPKLTQAAAFEVYGAWHCGNDYCTWSTVRNMTDFDAKNHWLIDRGDASSLPSVNLVVLSFVNPLDLLNKTSTATPLAGIPAGMTPAVVDYFKSHGVRVMLSIGGITYVKPWNQALAQNATQLGKNAALVAKTLGVGIEIDYEENRSPNLTGLEQFIRAYRGEGLPYDPSGANHAARLTIDLAAGDRWLIAITQKATAEWLIGTAPLLDYANAMVPARQPSAKDAIANWQEHVDGKPQYAPPIPPLAPARFTGSVYLVGSKAIPECNNFASSLQSATGSFVTSVASKVPGTSNGMLGYMFWAAECSGTRSVCTIPPSTCEKGVGAGASKYDVPIPMPPLTRY